MSDTVSICESSVRLLYDLLHGIKRMDVPLLIVIEFMILLGYDGQLEMGNSDMEKELFMSAVDQLKGRFKVRNFTVDYIRYITSCMFFLNL